MEALGIHYYHYQNKPVLAVGGWEVQLRELEGRLAPP